jgi:hypothetical protein
MLLASGNTELVPSFSAVRQLFEISRFSGRSGHTLYGPCRDRYDHREDAASRKVLDEWVASDVFGEVIGGPVRVGIALTSRHDVTDSQSAEPPPTGESP